MPRKTWTDEQETRLVELIEGDGVSCSVAASYLNMTRNQVVGKAWRMGLTRKGSDPQARAKKSTAGKAKGRWSWDVYEKQYGARP